MDEEMSEIQERIQSMKEEESELTTINVGQLIKCLQKFDPHKNVYVFWEGLINPLEDEGYIYETLTGNIFIDGDECSDKYYYEKKE